jgi:hypothetical protein
MKSVRLGEELEARLRQAALREGVSESEFIREAVATRANSVLSTTLEGRLAGAIGAVSSRRSYARDSHERYTQLLVERHRRKTKSRR